MQNSVQPSESRQRRSRAATGPLSRVAMALLPVLACFLGGATEKWAEGIVIALLGLLLAVRPPRLSFGPATNGVLIALLLLVAIAFLPDRWFFMPAWRVALVNDFGIPLPSMITPQPWLTSGCLVSLIAGLSWLYLVATQELELRAVRSQLRFFATGVVILASISILFYWTHINLPFWLSRRGFGPFPNRNQTANLFALTAIVILACGQDDFRKGKKRWIFWVLALGTIVSALILSLSRAGILILVVGSALWLGLFALRQRSTSWLALGLSFVLLLLTALLVFGGETLERFHLRDVANVGVSTDFRWQIFRDTFQLINNSPWCGIGLGNFESVFAIFRNASFSNTRALHPESDWLWLCSEMGWPAVIVVIAGLGLLVRRIFPLREGTNQRYRLATFIAAFLFAIHGIIDVSGHRVGTAFAGIFLLGLSLHRPLDLKPSRAVAVFFRLLGVGLCAAGISWVIAARGAKLLPGSVGVSNVKQLSVLSNRERDFGQTISLTTRALNWAPLDWQLYFARALAEVGAKQATNALNDFRRARFLEPNSYDVPLAEGNVWLSSQPSLAPTAFLEALRRARDRRRDVYSGMLNTESLQNPEVARILEQVGLSRPDLALAYLSNVSGETFRRGLAQFLKNDPNLESLTDPEKLALFLLWSERGNLDELVKLVQLHPDWTRYAWLGIAKFDASKKDFRSAYDLIERFGEPVALPRISDGGSLEDLEKRFAAAPDNTATGYALYHAQIQRGRVDDALQTARHFSERARSPAYFHYLEAKGWAAKQNWERAWNAWLAYREAIRK
jgi:O-antigen ligase